LRDKLERRIDKLGQGLIMLEDDNNVIKKGYFYEPFRFNDLTRYRCAFFRGLYPERLQSGDCLPARSG
jgi:hypothetical protein